MLSFWFVKSSIGETLGNKVVNKTLQAGMRMSFSTEFIKKERVRHLVHLIGDAKIAARKKGFSESNIMILEKAREAYENVLVDEYLKVDPEKFKEVEQLCNDLIS